MDKEEVNKDDKKEEKQQEVKQEDNSLSILALCFSITGMLLFFTIIFGIVLSLVGIVLSIIADKKKKGNKKINAAALAVGLISIIIIVSVFAIGGGVFLGKNASETYYKNKEIQEAVEEFDNRIASIETTSETNMNTSSNAKSKQTYKGFSVVGKIEIPKTKITTVVLDKARAETMRSTVGIGGGPGLNKIGNTVIAGVSYDKEDAFLNNSKLEEGDYIYITDAETGTRVKYIVYKKYKTSGDDFDFTTRDTEGKREITLSSTEDIKERLIICAKED